MSVFRKHSGVCLSFHSKAIVFKAGPPHLNRGGSKSDSSIILPVGNEDPIHLNKVKSRNTVVSSCSAL